jgi:hypothetical protein
MGRWNANLINIKNRQSSNEKILNKDEIFIKNSFLVGFYKVGIINRFKITTKVKNKEVKQMKKKDNLI